MNFQALEWQFDKLENRFDKLEWKFDKLEEKVDSMDQRLQKVETKVDRLQEEFMSFKNQTDDNFNYTNKLINQAFEKISENITYQDKVTQIERIIHSRPRPKTFS